MKVNMTEDQLNNIYDMNDVEKMYDLLIHKKFIHNNIAENEIKYVMNICTNNIVYLEDNYKQYNHRHIYAYRCNRNDQTIPISEIYLRVAFVVSNLNTIKKLIKLFELDVNKSMYRPVFYDQNDANYLIIACLYNKNEDVIQYLIDDQKMHCNVYDPENSNMNIVSLYCMNPGISLNMLKYLVEHLHISCTDYDYNKKKNNVDFILKNISHGLPNKEQLMIISYLIRKLDVYDQYNNCTFSAIHMNENIVKIIIPLIQDKIKLNLFLNTMNNEIKLKIINSLNPLLLDEKNQSLISFNINEIKFNQYIKFVDELDYVIPLIKLSKLTHTQTFYNSQYYEDYDSNSMKPIFTHNNLIYCGNLKKFHQSMLILKDIEMDNNELINLEGTQPTKIINLFVHCACSLHQYLDISIIPEHMMDYWISLIDQYPLVSISVDKIENELIQYHQKKSHPYSDLMITMCIKYQLKDMYLDQHNKKLQNINLIN